MVFFNYSTMQMAAKIVYYGPGLCGKTTNLQWIFGHTTPDSRGEMVSLETETDRTLFFDLLPMDVGTIAGFNTRIQLYTVPGQVFYNTTRKLVLKGVDGVVFVADSQQPMLQANIDSLNNLEENLAEMGLTLDEVPLVLQYNKRDLPDICSVDELDSALNRNGWTAYEASALNGQGVLETLKGISKLTLLAIKNRIVGGELGQAPGTRAAPQAEAAEPAGQAPKPAAKPPPKAAAHPAAAPRPQSGPATAAPKTKARRQVDVLGELEKLRRQAKGTAAGSVARKPLNGGGQLTRDVELSLKRGDLRGARGLSVTLGIRDEQNQVVELVRDLPVEIDELASLRKLLLRLNIDLSTRE